MKLKKSLLYCVTICLGMFVLSTGHTQPEYYNANTCASVGCHNAATPTCHGCHFHAGVTTYTMVTDRAVYNLTDTVTITVSKTDSSANDAASANWQRFTILEGATPVATSTDKCAPADVQPGCGNIGYPFNITVPASDLGTGMHNLTAVWRGNNDSLTNVLAGTLIPSHTNSTKNTLNVEIVESGAGGGGNAKPKSSSGAFGWELLLLGIPMLLRRKLT